MRRRDFIRLLGSAAAAWPLAAPAQQPGKMHRVAGLHGGSSASRAPLLAAFMRGMENLGYVEGSNLVIEHRFADNNFERLPLLAKELLSWKPDVLLVSTTPGSLAAKAATSDVPIVMVSVADPVGSGLVASLSRPGGNITGVTNIAAELAGKRLEILKELVPQLSKVAALFNPEDPIARLQLESLKPTAERLGVLLEPMLAIRSRDELKGAFEAAIHAGAAGALRMIDPTATEWRRRTAELAAYYRLPVVYAFREDVLDGGLASYGTNLPDQYRQAAGLVHKILAGTKPADLPIEQPTKFEFALNLKAANALDLAVPPSLLARADEVIE